MFLLAYVVLLLSWVVFAPAALRAAGPARRWATLAVGIGVAGLAREVWMTLAWVPEVVSPIRVDVPLSMVILIMVYASTSVALSRGGWRRTARLASALVATGVLGAAVRWTSASREAARLGRVVEEGNRLLFQAKFRNRRTYERYFGMNQEGDGFPVGHWTAPRKARHWRLVVNPGGGAFLFFPCGGTECQQDAGQLRPSASGWEAVLSLRNTADIRLSLGPPRGDTLPGSVGGTAITLVRTPPPLLDRSDGGAFAYLGAFSALEPVGALAQVGQIWLWREGEEVWAVGVFESVVPGQRAEFLRPTVLGRATSAGDGWRFHWSKAGRSWELRVARDGNGLQASFSGRGTEWPFRRLEPVALIRDERVELAPLTGSTEWLQWFEIQLVGHFASVDVPAFEPIEVGARDGRNRIARSGPCGAAAQRASMMPAPRSIRPGKDASPRRRYQISSCSYNYQYLSITWHIIL